MRGLPGTPSTLPSWVTIDRVALVGLLWIPADIAVFVQGAEPLASAALRALWTAAQFAVAMLAVASLRPRPFPQTSERMRALLVTGVGQFVAVTINVAAAMCFRVHDFAAFFVTLWLSAMLALMTAPAFAMLQMWLIAAVSREKQLPSLESRDRLIGSLGTRLALPTILWCLLMAAAQPFALWFCVPFALVPVAAGIECAFRSRARRRWLTLVRAGSVPGWRIVERSEVPSRAELLPFVHETTKNPRLRFGVLVKHSPGESAYRAAENVEVVAQVSLETVPAARARQ